MDIAKELRDMFAEMVADLKLYRKETLLGLVVGSGLYATMICMCKVIAVMLG